MSGGTFTNQNKVRPGAYINFRGIKAKEKNTGLRGTVALALSLPFGAEKSFVRITADDLVNGKAEALTGYKYSDSGSKLMRLALQNAKELLLYRLNGAGVKATEVIGGLVCTAKYEGTAGNFISVEVKEVTTAIFQVNTYFKSVLKDSQNIKLKTDIKSNDFVVFTAGSGELDTSVATLLTGGVDGAVGTQNYTDYLAEVATQNFNVISGYGIADQESIVNLVKNMREDHGRKVQGVIKYVEGLVSDYEGIIQTKGQGYKTAEYEVSEDELTVWLAGASAGAGATQSNTYKAVQEATEIINPVEDSAVEELLEKGYLLLTRRRNNDIVIEKDINTLVTLSDEKNEAFKKNRVVRIMDDLANYATETFETNFIGKVDNNATGRDLYKSNIIQYINGLVNLGSVQNFNSQEDIAVYEGEQKDSMVLELAIQPIDALEKLYMTVNVK